MDNELLLCALLDCGSLDLRIINDCEYDVSEVLEVVDEFCFEKIDLGAIAVAIVEIAKREISNAIDEKLENFKEELKELLEESEENQNSAEIENYHSMITDLESLNPHEDFELYFNYLDTHVSCVKNATIYKDLLAIEIDTISGTSGMTFYID